ncbi:MAG: SMP-30/gluconolactonase/LRE family protein [Ideonella sp.]|nr:SMP-30/gluconolactonase/LRE family protein [Ideonella sp.]
MTIKKFLLGLLALLLCAATYLLLWPVPISAQAWVAPPAPGYVGPHAPNTRLAGLQMISLGAEEGPEHVALGPDGWLYTAVASGKLLRMKPDGSEQTVWADTGGRVLGFDFDAQGRMIAADAMRGLLAITAGGAVSVLTDKVGDSPILYADAVVVAKSGEIFFSDASTRFGAKALGSTFEASVLDILEQSATGRVLAFSPATGQTRIVAQGLSFANGMALSADETQLFVAETGRYRVWRISTAATGIDVRQPSPQALVLLDNLPGYPDNLMRGQNNRLWMGLVKPRNPKIDGMAGKPWLRELTLRLPRATWPVPKAYGHVVAFSEQGQILADLQDPSGAYPEATAITETPERLYVHSLHAKDLGWRPNDLR